MDLSMKWLADYVKVDFPICEFAAGMTMSGSKVEKWKELSEPLSKIVAGRVLSVEKHNNSDRLWITKIDVGEGEPVQIVTGADNVFENAFVPVVLDGGQVFNRTDGSVMKIKKGKLRGELSQGMLCSYEELGLTPEYLPYAPKDGILILNEDSNFGKLKPGDNIIDFLGISDTVVEFEITNNRPDCLSIVGLAKETGATFDIPVKIKKPQFSGVEEEIDLTVEVLNQKLCSRYMAAVVRDVKIEASPRWMQERLKACGVRPINNYVDITNFVMLEYGHPMHAFDKKYVSGNKIIVRNAANGEKITLLDGSEQILNENMLVIADAEKPIAVAGVMGGEFSGIMDDTETVVFESACFEGVTVRRSAKKIGRRTESSSRFEKGIDSRNAKDALYRALELVEILGCGKVVRNVIDADYGIVPAKRIKHKAAAINEILGTSIHETEQVAILKKLGFEYDDGYVIPPSTRIDIEQQCDLAEEIARIYGYDRIKSTIPKLSHTGSMTLEEKLREKIEQSVVASGCYGCKTFGFISPKSYEKAGVCESLSQSVTIRNPLGETMSVMRTSAVPSMLEILARNVNNRLPDGSFYEIARVYRPCDGQNLPCETEILTIGLYGAGVDFYSLKGIVEELLENLAIAAAYRPNAGIGTYHPGRCADIVIKDRRAGVFGEIHPEVLAAYKINTRAFLAEISVAELLKSYGETAKYRQLPKYPAVTRDLSLVCPDEMLSAEIEDIIRSSGKHIEEISFFDIYKGSQIQSGMKSLSYKIILRKSDATLTDAEADKVMELILEGLSKKGIRLR